jgi:hypothetical protein
MSLNDDTWMGALGPRFSIAQRRRDTADAALLRSPLKLNVEVYDGESDKRSFCRTSGRDQTGVVGRDLRGHDSSARSPDRPALE